MTRKADKQPPKTKKYFRSTKSGAGMTSDKTTVGMSIRNLISIVTAVALGVYAYFGIVETLNQHSTRLELMEKDVELNTEFRIKWPRGLMGNLPADDEQYMLLEFLSGQVEKQQATLDENADTKIMIKHLEEMVDQLEKDVEKLKDATREIKFANGNGNGGY
jgi:hypothetical protein